MGLDPTGPEVAGAGGGPLRAVDLRADRRSQPLSCQPSGALLGWRSSSSVPGTSPAAWRVVMSEAPLGGQPAQAPGGSDPVIWDSGWVDDPEGGVDVPYEGPALEPRHRYRWWVRLRDQLGRAGPWSEPADLEVGLGDTASWEAGWVTASEEPLAQPGPDLDLVRNLVGPGEVPRWLWAADAGDDCTVRLLGTVWAPPGAQALHSKLALHAFRPLRAWVNGHPVEPVAADAPFESGLNVIAVEVAPGQGLPGVLASIEVSGEALRGSVSCSGPSWRAVAVPAGPPGQRLGANGAREPGWETQQAAPPWVVEGRTQLEAWPKAVVLGRHGDAPWGRLPSSYRPPLALRRPFELPFAPARGRLYVASLGDHRLWLNGEAVSDRVLCPGWRDFRYHVPYQVYDVTHLLAQGPNLLAALVADGWWAGSIAWFGRGFYGRSRALRAELEVLGAGGEHFRVLTDESWQAGRSKVRFADPIHGECQDARLEPQGWLVSQAQPPGFQPAVALATAAPALVAEQAPPVRPGKVFTPASVERREECWLVDFGQNFSGRARLRARGAPGARVVVTHAEVCTPSGDLWRDGLRTARATDEYLLEGTGDWEHLEPYFSVHGFRFARIDATRAEVDPASIEAVAVWADMEPLGSFSCSDPRLNRLQENIIWSARSNFLAVPTDCPQRDERLGWTGDVQVFAPTAAFNYDVRGFLESWLEDLRLGQLADGAIPHVAPFVCDPSKLVPGAAGWQVAGGEVGGPPSEEAGAAGWGDAIVTVPLALWEAYADRRALADNLEAVDRWVNYLASHAGAWEPGGGFGDWLAPEPTPTPLVVEAYWAIAAHAASTLAEAVGDRERASRFRGVAERARRVFRAHWLDESGVPVPATQTACVLALRSKSLGPAEIAATRAALVRDVRGRGHRLTTGFLGTPWLLEELVEAGCARDALILLGQEEYPSWLYPVVRGGATTIWERWDSWHHERGFGDPGMTSFNHYAYGAVGAFLYRHVLGLAPAAPGWSKARVAPLAMAPLRWAQGSLATPRGTIALRWELGAERGRLQIELKLPPGCKAEVLPPFFGTVEQDGHRMAEAGPHLPLELEPGTHRLEVKAVRNS